MVSRWRGARFFNSHGQSQAHHVVAFLAARASAEDGVHSAELPLRAACQIHRRAHEAALAWILSAAFIGQHILLLTEAVLSPLEWADPDYSKFKTPCYLALSRRLRSCKLCTVYTFGKYRDAIA